MFHKGVFATGRNFLLNPFQKYPCLPQRGLIHLVSIHVRIWPTGHVEKKIEVEYFLLTLGGQVESLSRNIRVAAARPNSPGSNSGIMRICTGHDSPLLHSSQTLWRLRCLAATGEEL